MTVQNGSRIGPYEIETALGAGGMGEVYRARDTRLNRRVAIKSLPAAFALDPERVARFKREAQLLAALNHPHIAGIHGLEEANGSQFLVLEFVDGETLADRLVKGPIPLAEAIKIAREVIDALEAAHEKGIIHRDLKPGNVALTADGQVKVLDFGLARYEAGDSGSTPDLTASPTLAYAGTQAGIILGTAAYMSPEQAKGRAVDKRTDVWAFGCLLYEMLSGKKAFEGEDVSDTLAAILRGEPDWSALPSDVPPGIVTLIKRCLEKDRRTRIPDLSVVRFLMTDPSGSQLLSGAVVSTGAPIVTPLRQRSVIPWIAASVFAAASLALLVLWAPWKQPPLVQPVRVSVEIGAISSLVPALTAVAISPDGSTAAFIAAEGANATHIFLRRLDQLQATMLSGTDGATFPFFSPDGQWVGFFSAGKLKKVAVSGGAAVTLCDATSGRGGWWADDGSILFQPESTPGTAMMRVPAAGGAPTPLLKLADGEGMQRWPQMLPGSRAVLYTSLGTGTTVFDSGQIVVQRLPDGPRTVLVKSAYFGRVVKSGHLLYMQQGTLFAAPFDPNRLELTGGGVPVVEAVLSSNANGSAQYAISDSGRLVHVSGATASSAAPIFWLDASGKTTSLRQTPADWSSPAFSPDGTRLAMDISDGTQTDIWVYDWARDTLSRLTFDKADDLRPTWSPDGRRIVFASKRGDKGEQNLYWQRADGTGEVQQLTEGSNVKYGGSFDPSGKHLAYTEIRPGTSSDVMILPLEGDEATGWKPGKATAFLSAPYVEGSPQFSPDGRWIAYLSNESGRNELYVRPFPGPGGKWQISNGDADDPSWSRTKREIFFLAAGTLHLMRSVYTVEGDSFRAEKPTQWSDTVVGGRPRPPSRDLDLHPDGQRFAIAAGAQGGNANLDKVVLTLNFFDELKRLTAKK
jgi:serine/threonine protein kinase/Tol biopolymer transport system component